MWRYGARRAKPQANRHLREDRDHRKLPWQRTLDRPLMFRPS